MSVLYHPHKDNVVADALSRMTIGIASHIDEAKKYLVRDAHRLVRLCEVGRFSKWWFHGPS